MRANVGCKRSSAGYICIVKIIGKEKLYQLEMDDTGSVKTIDGQPVSAQITAIGNDTWHILSGHRGYNLYVVQINREENSAIVRVNGNLYRLKMRGAMDDLLEKMGIDAGKGKKSDKIVAPMPGLVLNILVEPGMAIKKGENVLVLEAMKMENIIKSPSDGVIKSVEIKPGQAVDKNAPLMFFQ